ncbi:hypothetical protein LQ327_02715 [Actinomycetospora endophytica]|uniref:Molecular chaperone Hsp90 n=1 Tax=Actinomycetospora endophytica TaxID=2291215 RepID=A0ABS8P231_9PSEU|nr:hypothetical protein [Actinomycetospora endophytica]MCD2192308.1 hypothetical protein [Actinomycetospora endophytica]
MTSADGAPELRVGNAGAPLDADGVAALASLRASAKRDGGTVGRFGVGFAAVLALGDAPRVVTRGAEGTLRGVAFSRARTRDAVAERGGPLAAELEARDGDVPALRLVWPADPADLAEDLPDGADTEVRVALAGSDGAALLARAVDDAPDLLLALPWLAGVEAGGEVVRRESTEPDEAGIRRVTIHGPGAAATAWTTLPVAGELPIALVDDADLAVEDRDRTRWEGLWAVADDPAGTDVLHAPTPTAETTTLPARLVVTVPLDPDRRRVRAGPVTTHVLGAAAAAYPALVAALPPERRTALVPAAALPASGVDAVLRDGVVESLRREPWLPAAEGPDLAPARAVVVDTGAEPADRLVAALTGAIGDLVSAVVGGSADLRALAPLGVTRLGPADLAERLAGLRRPPSWWHALYDALAATPVVAAAREELAALPVPLVDGRLVPGARGTLLPGDDLADGLAAALAGDGLPGLRLVDPAAVHPLLESLGARRADAGSLLAEPELRKAVARSVDDADVGLDVDGLARVVLRLLADAGEGAADTAWGALALPDVEGSHRRADELVLPDGDLRGVLGDDSPIGVLAEAAVAEHGRAALLAAGVLDGFGVVRDDAPAGPDHDLDDEETWWAEEVDPAAGWDGPGEELPAGPPGAMVAVRDLDLVADDRWDAAWSLLASDRSVRSALVALPGEPVPYTSWWLARHGRLAGHPPGHWRLPDEAPGAGKSAGDDPGRDAALAALYDPVPGTASLDAGFLAAVGVRTELRIDGADDATDLLARLADPARPVPAGGVLAAHTALAEAADARRLAVADVEPPAQVRTAAGRVVDADPDTGAAPTVLDRPWLLAALDPDGVVPVAPGGAPTLADLLDLPTAAADHHGEIRSPGVGTAWTDLPVATAWAAAVGRALPAGGVVLHERLRVAVADDDRTGPPREVFPGVWVDGAVVHTDDPVRGLLAAWALGPS